MSVSQIYHEFNMGDDGVVPHVLGIENVLSRLTKRCINTGDTMARSKKPIIKAARSGGCHTLIVEQNQCPITGRSFKSMQISLEYLESLKM